MLNFIILLILLLSLYLVIPIINNKIVFLPLKVNIYNYYLICNNLKNNYIPTKIITPDKIELNGGLLNLNKVPDWNDYIILYSHGNAGWLGNYINLDSMKLLSNFGSIFIYDYRGYGINTGVPTEQGVYIDIKSVYKFLIKEKKINPDKIIIYGYSLGTSVSTKLLTYLIQNKYVLPKALILEAPFISISELAKELSVLLLPIVTLNLNNLSNILEINNKIPIYSIHSIEDEIIPYKHSEILKKYSNGNCNIIKISGNHLNPIFNKKVYELFENICNKN
jgi:hypothetical protein